MNRPKIIEDPTDGLYYGMCSCNSGGAYTTLALSASVPWGPYTYCGTLATGGSDQNIYVDYDGSRWEIVDGVNWAAVPVGWGSAGTPTNTGNGNEGVAAFRSGNLLYIIANPPSSYLPSGATAAQSYLSQILAPNVITNATIFTTAGQLLAAPAGAPNPWGWSGGTGIDPAHTYTTQCCCVFVTTTGQYIFMADRWLGSGIGIGTNTYVWLPLTFDGSGNPQIPFVSSFVPSVGAPATIAARQQPFPFLPGAIFSI